MTYRLYISYRDTCWHEKIVIEGESSTILYEEMKHTDVYETHWKERHQTLGIFPYCADSQLFPQFEQFNEIIQSLTNIGQIKYVMRSKSPSCSYYCCVKKLL